MSGVLEDKVALVTGAGTGIGRAIATDFASEGAIVAVTGRNIQRLEQVVSEIRLSGGQAIPWQMDVSDEVQVEDTVNQILGHWDRIDILVNNAAIIHHDTPVWRTSIKDWDEEMAINLRGTFLCCHFVVASMAERHEGVVINIGSSSGTIPEDMCGPYGATKWGVVGYTMSLAKSVRPRGVRVASVLMGLIQAGLTPI